MQAHVESHSQLHPVYLDKNSGLNKTQRDSLNTILFGQYRRFRRAANVIEDDEPRVLKNFSSTTSAVQDIYDRSYGIAHSFSAVMSVANKEKGNKVFIGKLSNKPSTLFQCGGTGYNNSEPLPGYFAVENDDLVFMVNAEHDNDYFKIYLFWMD